MKNYVVGGYYESADQIETMANDPIRKILDILKDTYPYANTENQVEEDLEKDTRHVRGTINKGIGTLQRHGFIHQLSKTQREDVIAKKRFHDPKGGRYDARFYIIEQSDSTINLLSRHDDPKIQLPKYILAPGYVEYDEKFSNAWDILLSKPHINGDTLRILLKGILQLLNTVLGTIAEDEDTKEVTPSTGYSSKICTNCGINHEARSFLRAVMLKVLDYIEISQEYREFLRETNVLNNLGVEHYKNAGKYYEKVLKSLSEEKGLERRELKVGLRSGHQKPPAGAIWMMIVAMYTYRLRRRKITDFIAVSSYGKYISGTVLNRLKPRNMEESKLVEYSGPIDPHIKFPDQLYCIDMGVWAESEGSMRVFKQDDESIAGPGTIPLDSISNIKQNDRIYHISGRITDKEESVLRSLPGNKIRIKDDSGEIAYHFATQDAFDKVKIGDRINVFGSSNMNKYGVISLAAMAGADAIQLSET